MQSNNLNDSNEDVNFRIMKQKYLREQIVELGYDPIKFSEYLDSRKKDGKLKRNKYRQLGI